ncbi:MAG: ribosomal protein L7/L12 [Myxococcota bacterium]
MQFGLGALVGIVLILVIRAFRSRPRVPVPPTGEGTMDDVRRLASQGHKIAAIKVYREIHGVGLKEAKEAVERLDL